MIFFYYVRFVEVKRDVAIKAQQDLQPQIILNLKKKMRN